MRSEVATDQGSCDQRWQPWPVNLTAESQHYRPAAVPTEADEDQVWATALG